MKFIFSIITFFSEHDGPTKLARWHIGVIGNGKFKKERWDAKIDQTVVPLDPSLAEILVSIYVIVNESEKTEICV